MSNVSTQAFIQGVNDDFLIAALISFIGFLPILFLKSKRKAMNSFDDKQPVGVMD